MEAVRRRCFSIFSHYSLGEEILALFAFQRRVMCPACYNFGPVGGALPRRFLGALNTIQVFSRESLFTALSTEVGSFRLRLSESPPLVDGFLLIYQ